MHLVRRRYGVLMHLQEEINTKKNPLPAFHTMCKKIPFHVLCYIGLYYFRMQSTLEFKPRPQREEKKRCAVSIFVGIIFEKKSKRATPGIGTCLFSLRGEVSSIVGTVLRLSYTSNDVMQLFCAFSSTSVWVVYCICGT